MGEIQHLSQREKLFVEGVLNWGKENRRLFVWRERNDDFFTVFVSEFFLRKTKSETVDSFMRNVFLKKYESFEDIAAESENRLRETLKPLGLHNQRASALKKIAVLLLGRHRWPTCAEIRDLPHCGRYIANAVECFFWKRKKPIVDHNVQRVFNRFFSIPTAVEIHKADYLWQFAERLLPPVEYVNYNYSLLDFSALICKPRSPRCAWCPVAPQCTLHLERADRTAGEGRHVQGVAQY